MSPKDEQCRMNCVQELHDAALASHISQPPPKSTRSVRVQFCTGLDTCINMKRKHCDIRECAVRYLKNDCCGWRRSLCAVLLFFNFFVTDVVLSTDFPNIFHLLSVTVHPILWRCNIMSLSKRFPMPIHFSIPRHSTYFSNQIRYLPHYPSTMCYFFFHLVFTPIKWSLPYYPTILSMGFFLNHLLPFLGTYLFFYWFLHLRVQAFRFTGTQNSNRQGSC